MMGSEKKELRIPGAPNAKQKEFFLSRARYTAYGGARGGGKSWALRRKLVGLCLCYPGIRCLILRRTLDEVYSNHVLPILSEMKDAVSYSSKDKTLFFPKNSTVKIGYLANEGDLLRYQGQEYDVIALDEATQFPESAFTALKACLRGTGDYPRRMYLTCNPGGIGHAWVKRLFIDRDFRAGEEPEDYAFIPASVFDNPVLTEGDPGYVKALQSLPQKLRDAWLYGKWDAFAGQFFPEFSAERHIITPDEAESRLRTGCESFISFDYGFDMLAALWISVSRDGSLTVYRELCVPGLTLSAAARAIVDSTRERCSFCVASPDLWNRRQDSGLSGVEIMSSVGGLPPLRRADDRRIPGWNALREYLSPGENSPGLTVSSSCNELIRCMSALLFSKDGGQDASSEPHSVTHAPEALRYGVMARVGLPGTAENREFRFRSRKWTL